MKVYLIFIISIFVLACKKPSVEIDQKESSKDLKWIDMQTAAKLDNTEGKMYFIDVYTDWCGWCKVMDKKTFSDEQVKQKLGQRFHVVKFNAEQKETIIMDGKTYPFQEFGRNGVNTLAAELLSGELSYPAFVYLDKNRKPIKVSKGYMDVDHFLLDLEEVK